MKHLDLQRLSQILRPQLPAPFYQEYGEVNVEIEENGFPEEPHRPSALQPRSQETAAFALGRNYLFLQPWLGPHRRWPPMASAAWPRHLWHPHKRRSAGSTSRLTVFPARPAMSRWASHAPLARHAWPSSPQWGPASHCHCHTLLAQHRHKPHCPLPLTRLLPSSWALPTCWPTHAAPPCRPG